MIGPLNHLKSQLLVSIEYLSELLNILEDHQLIYYSAGSRPLGEILMHMIRSQEYYLVGLYHDNWEFLTYTFDEYNTITKIKALYQQVGDKTKYITSLLSEEILFKDTPGNVFGLNLLVEYLQHNSHHIGQLLIYLRNLEINPPAFHFII
ncbi:MAG: DinB family protein [Candidatus Heimdallarchaeota archaeon]|nr:DinB family protein [Candidatus Heimdallarchaeota archaeon]